MTSDYHKKSFAEKRAYVRDKLGAPPARCPCCEAGVAVEDLLSHIERCTGPATPHRLDRWVLSHEAVELVGVSTSTLARWVQEGRVRARWRRPRRQYLLRDLVRRVAAMRLEQTGRNRRARTTPPSQLRLPLSDGDSKGRP